MAGVDRNGGYRGYDSVEPLLGAFSFTIAAADPHRAIERFGLLFTVIPPAARRGANPFVLERADARPERKQDG